MIYLGKNYSIKSREIVDKTIISIILTNYLGRMTFPCMGIPPIRVVASFIIQRGLIIGPLDTRNGKYPFRLRVVELFRNVVYTSYTTLYTYVPSNFMKLDKLVSLHGFVRQTYMHCAMK